MHLLEDLTPLSDLARSFLLRAGDRVTGTDFVPSALLDVRNAAGARIPVPSELAIRRDQFARDFAGLTYRVRRSAYLPPAFVIERRQWSYELGSHVGPDGDGWYFDWLGEHVSAPVRYVQHTDGRSGVSLHRFIPVYATPLQMIESHALTDLLADWAPHRKVMADVELDIGDLPLVEHASGPWLQWRMTDDMAVCRSLEWTDQRPRVWRARVWRRAARPL